MILNWSIRNTERHVDWNLSEFNKLKDIIFTNILQMLTLKIKKIDSEMLPMSTRKYSHNTRIIDFLKMKNLKNGLTDFIRKYDYYEKKDIKG